MKRLTILLLAMFLLMACTSSGEPAASEQPATPAAEGSMAATAVPQANIPRTEGLPAPDMAEPTPTEGVDMVPETVEEAEATALPEAEPMEGTESEETDVTAGESPAEDTASMVVSGRVDEGAFFLGDPNAPVTLIDYSDFL